MEVTKRLLQTVGELPQVEAVTGRQITRHHAPVRSGDILDFKGKARGLSVQGTVEVTDGEVIIDAKLPFIAMPFEGRIRQTVEQEAEKMFRTA